MNETPKQYTSRLLSYIEGRKPLRVIAATPAKLKTLTRGISGKQLRKRPAPGVWSAVEIIAHLAETELVIGYRIRKILEKSGTPIQAFEQDLWQKSAGYLHNNPALALELFATLRKSNVRLLTSLPRRKWKCYGMHAERGKETIEKVVHLEAGHDINHLRQLRRLVG